MMKQKYWQYTVNELGCMDIKAQVAWIHNVKTDEMRAGRHTHVMHMPVHVGYDVATGG